MAFFLIAAGALVAFGLYYLIRTLAVSDYAMARKLSD